MPSLTKKAGKAGGKGVRKLTKRSLPVKRSINLATAGEKPINPLAMIPSLVAVIVVAALVSKFAVIDRLMQVSEAQQEVAILQSRLTQSKEKLDDFGELTQEYAHYTYSGMTSEEMNRTDRLAVLELMQRLVLPQAWVSTWSVQGNTLTLDITRGDLQDINLLAQQLNQDPLVDFCTVTTAATTSTNAFAKDGSVQGDVVGHILIYLNSAPDQEKIVEDSETAEAQEQEESLASQVIGKTANTMDSLAQAREESEARVEGMMP